jgi:hypothetical protein
MTGMYYTPKEIEKIANPSTGTGAFLKQAADGLSNPPYAFQHGLQRTAGTWRKLWSFISGCFGLLRRR